jgi:peroxiredoxin Q/BCP
VVAKRFAPLAAQALRSIQTRRIFFLGLRLSANLPNLFHKSKMIMKANWFKTLFVVGSMLFSTAAVQAAMPKVGDTAPLFTGQDQDGNTVKLADLTGKKIVLLYFYPKDFTSGCTKEACGFRDRMSELQKDNVEIIGVSFDSAESHQKFIATYKLNFPLLADPGGKIVDAYGVKWGDRKLARRVSFLIGLDGKIVHITDAANPDVHFSEMQAAIAGLNKS